MHTRHNLTKSTGSYIPRLIFWEITKNCNLKCPYCRRESLKGGLSREEAFLIIDKISHNYKPVLVFSGGEPLTYPYIFEAAEYARGKGLVVALASNGVLINPSVAEKIKKGGFHRVAISLDGRDPLTHNKFRGEGSFQKTISAIKLLIEREVSVQVNTTVFRSNYEQIPDIHNFCKELGVRSFHIFAFVPVGCGITIPSSERLNPQEYERFLKDLLILEENSSLEIKLTCAPTYYRILLQGGKKLPVHISKGCLAGGGICFISSKGEVYPCGYLPISAGNILNQSFEEIWQSSSLFKTLREPANLKGKCRVCEYVNVCGGCRARAFSKYKDYLGDDDCLYEPLKPLNFTP